jgi:SAM-dependent methyltransferase
MSVGKDDAFRETYAELYDRHLVPMLFAPYARTLADRVKALHPGAVLETAAGTGIATQELAKVLPADVQITATDLNQPMIEQAKRKPGVENVEWQQADAMNLPFPDRVFDLVACQFGVMFFPDKQAAFREALRVLRPGGRLLFVVWDDWTQMPAAPLGIAADVVAGLLGCDPGALVNPPYYDESTIQTDLRAAGFQHVDIDRINRPATAASARDAAVATVHGSLIRTVIETTASGKLNEATDLVERAIRNKLGDGQIVGGTTALVILAN